MKSVERLLGLALLPALGCFSPSQEPPDLSSGGATDGETEASTDSPPTTQGTTTNATTGATTTSATGTSIDPTMVDDTGGSTATGGSGSSSGEPFVPECDDGLAGPGEFCFEPAEPLTFQDSIIAFGVGDVNGDGVSDVAVAIADQLQLALGSDGGLSDVLDSTNLSIQLADFIDLDDSGTLDLVFLDGESSALRTATPVGLDFTVGDAEVAPPEGLSLVQGSSNIVSRGAGTVGIDADQDRVRVWSATTDGIAAQVENIGVSSGTTFLEVADMNDDGIDDVLLGGSSGGGEHLRRYFGGAGGSLVGVQADLLAEMGVAGDGLSAVGVGDFDGDRQSDIAIAVSNSIIISYGDGVVGFEDQQVLPSAAIVTELYAVDLDGDSADELVFVENGASDMATLVVRRFDDRGASEEVFAFSPGHRLGTVADGDLNADGVVDLAVDDNFFNGVVEVLLSTP